MSATYLPLVPPAQPASPLQAIREIRLKANDAYHQHKLDLARKLYAQEIEMRGQLTLDQAAIDALSYAERALLNNPPTLDDVTEPRP